MLIMPESRPESSDALETHVAKMGDWCALHDNATLRLLISFIVVLNSCILVSGLTLFIKYFYSDTSVLQA